jgi:hypothetical protein
LQFAPATRSLVQVRAARPGLREGARRALEYGVGHARRLRDRLRALRSPSATDTAGEQGGP